MLELYYAPGSCAFASLVSLCEAGAEFEAHRVALAEGEQHSEWFRKISPRGRVPVLIAGGETITETVAVLSYIDAAYPAAGLLPHGDPVTLAKAYELMAWLASGVHVTIAQLFRSERFLDDEGGVALLKAAAPERLDAAFVEIEERIAGPWALPGGYSVLDPYLGVFYRWAEQRLEVDMTRFPRWQEQNARLLERPAVKAAIEIESAPAKVSS